MAKKQPKNLFVFTPEATGEKQKKKPKKKKAKKKK